TDGTWNDTADQPPGGGYIVEFEPPTAPPSATAAQLLLFPNPVPGGLLALGQLVLAQPVGVAGAVLNLTSSNPTAAVVPAAVSILPGATTATFPILTFPVAAATAVQITAGGSAGAATATLQVLPLGAPAPPAVTGGNLLVNGSFEEPPIPNGMAFLTLQPEGLLGWRIVRGTVDVHQSWQQAPGQG